MIASIIASLLPFILRLAGIGLDSWVAKGKIDKESAENFKKTVEEINKQSQDPSRMRTSAKDQREQIEKEKSQGVGG